MNKGKEIKLMRCVPSGLKVRESGTDSPSRTITGYAILFNTRSRALWADEREEAYEIIAPEAVTRELLDKSDIKMTMFHNRELILARSNGGNGTLSYGIDDKGVYFEFEAPNTADGDKALELVSRGDLAGCSFAFTTYYFTDEYVSCEVSTQDGKTVSTYTVRAMTGIYDFTLAADPAYPDTSVELSERELIAELTKPTPAYDNAVVREQVAEMRKEANRTLRTL